MREGCDRHRFNEKLLCEFTMGWVRGDEVTRYGDAVPLLAFADLAQRRAAPRASNSNLALRLWGQSKTNLYTNLG